MSDTPRTDAARKHAFTNSGMRSESVVPVSLAYELERDLAQRTAALEQMTVHRNATIEHRDITQQVLNGITVALSQRTADLAKANAERDEARREVCYAYGPMAEALAAARRRGWDCFDAPHTNTPDVPVQDGGAA